MGETKQAGVGSVPAPRRLLSFALAVEVAWVLLTAAVVLFLAGHLGDSSDRLSGDATGDRFLVYLVPPLAFVLVVALVGARQALGRGRERRRMPPTSRVALWMAAAGNAGLVAAVAVTLYHAQASWVVLGGVIAGLAALVTAGCARAARPPRR